MRTNDFETCRCARLAEGFDDVTERVWSPGAVASLHNHPFSDGSARC